VGTGAGGGTAARFLAEAGLAVVLVEEGPLKSSADFRMRESDAYPELYQESAARRTRDKAIGILQGRCVGGGTTVNWTSSFARPMPRWAIGSARSALQVSVRRISRRGSRGWNRGCRSRHGTSRPNANNAALARGAAKIGISSGTIRRNVKGCWNIGYCGMGCPDQRQAVDAGHDDPGRARARRDAGDARARRRIHLAWRARGSAGVPGDGRARHAADRHAAS
jgi:hypothetical protein